jgi:hypothetical protein
MPGLRCLLSRVDAEFNQGARALVLRDITKISFDQHDAHVMADQIAPCLVTLVVTVDECALQPIDFHG